LSRKKIKELKFCDECRDEYELSMLCRSYLRLQRGRISFELTLQHIRPETETYEILDYYYRSIHDDEKGLLDRIKPVIERQPLWKWCSVTDGLGYVAALTFHSFIRTHVHVPICPSCGIDVRTPKLLCPRCGRRAMVSRRIEIDTAGKTRSYFGLFPGAELKAGKRGRFSPLAKGRTLGVIVLGIMRARKGKGDSYYRSLLDAKKFFYANNSEYAPALKDPTLCPRYEPCLKKYQRKAEREEREPKKPTCKAHIDNLAKRWIGGILVSHATQLIREGRGLDTSNFKSHRSYIRPKALEDDTPDPDVLEQIRTGYVQKYWKK